MAKPATETRLAASAKGFTQVIKRGDNHIVTRDPTTGKCCYDGQVGGGGWHYGDGQETDTAWQAGVAPWNYQMVKAGYNLFALSNLANGQVIKWLDPVSGQSVAFQPMALQWTNALNQIQQISMPQSVAAQVDDDTLYWPDGYGAGRHFKYIASPSRLNKLLIIDSAASLPSTSYDTLELNFIMGMSSGVTAYVDSGSGLAAWYKKTQKDTVKAIEFRLSNGTVVWSFAVPTAYDSADRSTAGTMRLKKQGGKLYVSVRFPKSWIDSAVFPIMIDPTVDYQVGAGSDDARNYGSTHPGDGGYADMYTSINLGASTSNYYIAGIRFQTVAVPAGATVDHAYASFNLLSAAGDAPSLSVACEDADDASTFSSGTHEPYDAYLDRTTAIISWSPTETTVDNWFGGAGETDEIDLKTLVQEVIDRPGWASGNDLVFVFWYAPTSLPAANTIRIFRSYEMEGNVSGPKLHIEYTEAAAQVIFI